MRFSVIALLGLAVMGLGMAGGAAPAHAAEPGDGVKTVSLTAPSGDIHQRAAEEINRVGQDAIAILSNQSLSKDERTTYFRKVLSKELDIPVLAKFMLGRYWKHATPEQRTAYTDVFTAFLLQTYSVRLGGVKVNALSVLKAQAAGNTKDVFVHSLVRRANAGPIRAVWRVRPYGEDFRIVDLIVEGISMAVTLRQEFGSILQKDGVDGLVTMLQGRLS